MNSGQQGRCRKSTAAAMQGVPEHIVQRQLGQFHKADLAHGAGLAMAWGVTSKPSRWLPNKALSS